MAAAATAMMGNASVSVAHHGCRVLYSEAACSASSKKSGVPTSTLAHK